MEQIIQDIIEVSIQILIYDPKEKIQVQFFSSKK